MNETNIDFQQPAYQQFRSLLKERTSRVVAFVGSGFSVRAGLPTWPQLRQNLTDAAERKIPSFDEDSREALYRKLEVARGIDDYWRSLDLLCEILGPATWKSQIKKNLLSGATASVPDAYTKLWRLPFRGVLTLNLDRLTTKAFIEATGNTPLEINGSDLRKSTSVLQGTRRFIANLHGSIELHESWILRGADLRRLQKDRGYGEALRAFMTSHTILFLGMTVDDIAVDGHLKMLRSLGVDHGPHYWLSDRVDLSTDQWAEQLEVQIIRYRSEDSQHRGVDEFLDDLLAFVPEDDAAPPVASQAKLPFVELAPPESLVGLSADEIRRELNAEAQRILQVSTTSAYQQFREFCVDYEEPIHRAWFASTRPGKNQMLDYTLDREIARGAFGTLYRAKSPTGCDVALKLLHNEIRGNEEALQCFRRGVRSMRILSQSKVEGMVELVDASEIPAFAVMEWIPGPNLRELVEARRGRRWPFLLELASELAGTIRKAHRLPERVLHRDLRPSNVILEGYWNDASEWNLVVTDFDLSWHVGSQEKSIIHGSSTTGYLAPEQIRKTSEVSTRSATVDSFGFGMTMFFIISARNPLPAEHAHSNWSQSTVEAADGFSADCDWKSVPRRFSRVILNCTRDKQSDRWDMGQVEAELKRLKAMVVKGEVLSAELAAEELICRSSLTDYEWCDNRLEAAKDFPSGGRITLQAEEARSEVVLVVSWTSSGMHMRRKIRKWLPSTLSRIRGILKQSCWRILSQQGKGELRIEAIAEVRHLVDRLDESASQLDKVVEELRFD